MAARVSRVVAQPIDQEALDTLRARAALLGYACGCTSEGWIVLRRIGGASVFDSVDDAMAWVARRAGVAS